MNAKSFLAGAVCGGVCGAIASLLIVELVVEGDRAVPGGSSAPAQAAGNGSGGDPRAESETANSREPSPAERQASLPDPQPAGPTMAGGPAVSGPPGSDPPGPERADDDAATAVAADADETTTLGDGTAAADAARRWYEESRSRFAAEPIDANWSYFSEQAIQQFIGSHPMAGEFTLEYVTCRTSGCQIGVSGADELAGMALTRLLYDMRQQTWYSFGQTGTSAGIVDGRRLTIAELRRLRAPSP